MMAQLVIVGDISGETDAARVEMLIKHPVVGVGHLVSKRSPAQLSVDEKASLAGSEVSTNERRLEAVAKARRRIGVGRSDISRLRSQVADRRARVQIPSVQVQP